MRKTVFICLLVSLSTQAGEFRIGHGTYKLKGGFWGLEGGFSTDVTSYSLAEEHRNLQNSNWFYNYNFTLYQSDTVNNYQSKVNSIIGRNRALLPFPPGINPPTPPGINPPFPPGLIPPDFKIPGLDYKYEGIDADIGMGYDIYHEGEDRYIGLGLNLGVSLPWVDVGISDMDKFADDMLYFFQTSKTTITTYKIGPNLTGRMPIYKFASVYGSASVAYQTGDVKNDYADADFSVDGWFSSVDLGLRFQNVDGKYKPFGFDISSNLYANLGYRYSYWKVDDVAIDITGMGLQFDDTDMSMSTSVGYFSIGYNF